MRLRESNEQFPLHRQLHPIGGIDKVSEIAKKCFGGHIFQTFISHKATKSPRKSKNLFSWFT